MSGLAWEIEHHRGPASQLHGLDFPDPAGRAVWVMEPTGPAVVVGSTQHPHDVDGSRAAGAGVEVVRRRSGGGAVLLLPGQAVWIDVLLPASDPLWDDDVGRSFHWLGDAWVEALSALGTNASTHRGPLLETGWSDRICFAGLGPGEVTDGGRKIVGLSQRRSRAGARFQCLALADWDPTPLLDLLDLTPGERIDAIGALADAAVGVGSDRLADVADRFVEAVVAG